MGVKKIRSDYKSVTWLYVEEGDSFENPEGDYIEEKKCRLFGTKSYKIRTHKRIARRDNVKFSVAHINTLMRFNMIEMLEKLFVFDDAPCSSKYKLTHIPLRVWKKAKINILKNSNSIIRYVGEEDSFVEPKNNYIDHVINGENEEFIIHVNGRTGISSCSEVEMDHLQVLIDCNDIESLESIFIFKD